MILLNILQNYKYKNQTNKLDYKNVYYNNIIKKVDILIKYIFDLNLLFTYKNKDELHYTYRQ